MFGQENQYAADAADDPLDQQPLEELGLSDRPDLVCRSAEPAEERFQPIHRVLSDSEGELEHEIHHQQKNRHAEKAVRDIFVDHIRKLAAAVVADRNRLPAGRPR